MDADLLMQTIAEVLKKIEDYSISNRAEFEALVKKNLAMQQTDQTKKQQKRIPLSARSILLNTSATFAHSGLVG